MQINDEISIIEKDMLQMKIKKDILQTKCLKHSMEPNVLYLSQINDKSHCIDEYAICCINN